MAGRLGRARRESGAGRHGLDTRDSRNSEGTPCCTTEPGRWQGFHGTAAERGKTFLIRSCIDPSTLDGNGRLVERYFTRLPGRLEAEGHHVTILPWLYNFSGSLAAAYATFRRLRGPGCLIIEDHIRVARDLPGCTCPAQGRCSPGPCRGP